MSKKLDIPRKQSDTFPIKLRDLKLDGNIVDLTSSTVTLRFEKNDETVGTITGTNLTTQGGADFLPLSTDFDEVGEFDYNIIVDDGTFETTYFHGEIKITERV